jgi:hypothetical protein
MSVLQSIARVLVGEPPPRPSTPLLPDLSPLTDEPAAGQRQDAALKLMDEDCYGFLMLTMHRHEEPKGHFTGRIDFAVALQRDWWPAVVLVLERIIRAMR